MRIHLQVKTTQHQSPLQVFACHSLIKVSWKLPLVISLTSPQSPGKLVWTRPGDVKKECEVGKFLGMLVVRLTIIICYHSSWKLLNWLKIFFKTREEKL